MATDDEARDPVYKGCTRPAMFLGVPVMPLVIVCISGFTIATLLRNMFLLGFLVPIILTMRFIVKNDDQQFRLLWLGARFRLGNRNKSFWRAYAYSPIKFQKRQNQ